MRRFLWEGAVAAIWGAAAAALSAEITVPAGVVAAVAGALCGLPAGRRAAASRIRLVFLWLAAISALLILLPAAGWLTVAPFWSAILNPSGALAAGEVLAWFGGMAVVVGLIRASSRRQPAFLALELAVLGAIFAGAFAAHRGGFINRPYALVDPLWAAGYDPLPVFLLVGILIACILIVPAAHRASRRRSFLDLALLFGMVAAIFLLFPLGKLKEIPPQDSGGGSGQQERNNDQGGGKGNDGRTYDANQGPQAGDSQDQGSMSSFADQAGVATNQAVAVVLFRDDYNPPAGYYYFRQSAFSQYNGRRLVQDTSGLADRDLPAAFPTGTTSFPVVGGQAEASLPSFFRTLDTTVALMVAHPRPFMLVNAEAASPRANPDPKRFLRAYDARSQVMIKGLSELSRCVVGSKSWNRALLKHYTLGPADPRYAELASGLMEALKPEFRDQPMAKALAVKYWLDANGIYSLESDHEKGGDPVSDFLFGDRTGHCVFFAHAACLLMRAAGVPARVGAGYAVEARNRGDGSSLLIRERDAHAWPEIYLEGLGWTPLDITPEKSLAPPEDAPDQGLQQMLGEMARQGAGNPRDEQEPVGRGDLQEFLRQLLRHAMAGLALLFLFALLALYGAKIYRRLAPYCCRRESLPRLAYRSSLDCLAEAGRLRSFGQTREGFAASLADLSPAFAALTARHLSFALGKGHPEKEAAECLALYAASAREVAQATPWWRRILGAIHPLAWVRVK